MSDPIRRISFGPVPSRRLGHSLGINNIPHKACSYSCVYCQVGRTRGRQLERTSFYHPEEIVRDVANRLEEARRRKEPVDYLTFVPDGEPTLDENMGKAITALKSFGVKIAVITNASLLWRPDVRDELQGADWVSVKVDAVSADVWRKVNKAHQLLKLETVLQGTQVFSASFDGMLVTETMLIRGLNDSAEEINRVAEFICGLKPSKSYIAIPIRPPAEEFVKASSASDIARSYAIFTARSLDTEYLSGYEGNAFAFTGNIEEDILSITAVHPMREDAVHELLRKAGSGIDIVHRLVQDGMLVEALYENNIYYMRKFK